MEGKVLLLAWKVQQSAHYPVADIKGLDRLALLLVAVSEGCQRRSGLVEEWMKLEELDLDHKAIKLEDYRLLRRS